MSGETCAGRTWPKVVSELRDAMHFVDDQSSESLGFVELLQFRHDRFALGNLFCTRAVESVARTDRGTNLA